MLIEHLAFQHPDPVGAAAWYGQHLGLSVARASSGPSQARFLVDSSGHTMLEIYNNADVPMPDYPKLHPLVLHIAFLSVEVQSDIDRLVTAGAKLVEASVKTPDGDTLVMLRDPWGVPLQLVQRITPLIV